MLTDKEIEQVEQRVNQAQPGPWKACIEGRDHQSGADFIMTGTDDNSGEDIEIIAGTIADYEFIANARQDIPKLIETIRALKQSRQ